MSCIVLYSNKACKVMLPFPASDDEFRHLITKLLELTPNAKYRWICESHIDPNSEQIITSPQHLEPGRTYRLIYINERVKRIQRLSRRRTLNKMRRKVSALANLPFSKRTKSMTSRKSWNDLLSSSSQLVSALKR